MAASGSNTRITYVEETVWGTTPATPQTIVLRGVTSESLGGNQAAIVSQELNPNRGVSYTSPGQKEAGGDISFELGTKGAISLIAKLLGTITTTGTGPYVHTATVGQEPKSFTIEKWHKDMAFGFVFPGSKPNSFSLNFTPEGIVTGSVNFISKDANKITTELDSTPTEKSFAFFDGIRTTVYIGGVAHTLSSLTLNGTNNLESARSLGSDSITDIASGRFEITGNIVLPLTVAQALPLIDKAKARTEDVIRVVSTNGTYSVEVIIPRVSYSGDVVPKAGGNGMLNLELAFNGLLDVNNESIKLIVTTDEATL